MSGNLSVRIAARVARRTIGFAPGVLKMALNIAFSYVWFSMWSLSMRRSHKSLKKIVSCAPDNNT